MHTDDIVVTGPDFIQRLDIGLLDSLVEGGLSLFGGLEYSTHSLSEVCPGDQSISDTCTIVGKIPDLTSL